MTCIVKLVSLYMLHTLPEQYTKSPLPERFTAPAIMRFLPFSSLHHALFLPGPTLTFVRAFSLPPAGPLYHFQSWTLTDEQSMIQTIPPKIYGIDLLVYCN